MFLKKAKNVEFFNVSFNIESIKLLVIIQNVTSTQFFFLFGILRKNLQLVVGSNFGH